MVPLLDWNGLLPEQWPGDFAKMNKMKELGVNAVRMGEFAWSSLEPSPDRFEFGWLDEAIPLCHHYYTGASHGAPVTLGENFSEGAAAFPAPATWST